MDYTGLALPKPEPRKRLKAREKRSRADHVKAVRDYVFGRERGMCRCCRARAAQSMHELIPRSRGGKVCRRNSVAVCGELGNDPAFCHGLLQTHQIVFGSDQNRAESESLFTPVTQRAADHLRIRLGDTIASPPMREFDDDSVSPGTDRRAHE